MISIDNIINFFTFQNIIIILLVVVVIYLLIKTHKNSYNKNNKNNKKAFFAYNSIADNSNVKAINNLGQLSKKLMTDNIIEIQDNFIVMGDSNITPRGFISYYPLADLTTNKNLDLPKGWAYCNGTYAWINPNGTTVTNGEYNEDESKNKGYILTPNFDTLADNQVYPIIRL